MPGEKDSFWVMQLMTRLRFKASWVTRRLTSFVDELDDLAVSAAGEESFVLGAVVEH